MVKFISLLLALIPFSCLAAASPLSLSDEYSITTRNGGVCTDSTQFEGIAVCGRPLATSFCETGWDTDFLPITNLTVWWNYYNIIGMQASYADGTVSPVYGTATGSVGSIGVDYAQGQRWNGWTMYYSYINGNAYVNSLYISNSAGTVLYAGQTPYQLQQSGLYNYPIPQNVGSGFLYGFNGTHDSSIGSLSALFLTSDISNIRITDFEFTDEPTGTQDIAIDTLSTAHYYNGNAPGTGTTSWMFQNSEAIATSHTFTSGITNTYGTSEAIQISGKIPVIDIGVQSTTTFSWMTAYAEMNAYQTTETTTVTWSEGGNLNPQTGVDAAAAVGHGQGTYPYSATITLTLKNGYSTSFRENGALTINDVSNAVVTTTTDDNP